MERGKKRLNRELYEPLVMGVEWQRDIECTEPCALRRLWQLSPQTNGRLSARVSRDPRFRRKVYLYRGKRIEGVFIGSQNMTAEGLSGSGEISMEIREAGKFAKVEWISAHFQRDGGLCLGDTGFEPVTSTV
jgi:hypothetical protein